MINKVSTVSRYLLGLIFLLSGIAGLFNLIPPPADLPQGLMDFMSGMMAAKYFMPFLKSTEIVTGLFLLLGMWAPLMLIILAPIAINIFLVHLFLTPGAGNLVVPVLILVLLGLSAVNYWNVFAPLLKRKN